MASAAKVTAAFQGELGAFSQAAIRQLLGEKAKAARGVLRAAAVFDEAMTIRQIAKLGGGG